MIGPAEGEDCKTFRIKIILFHFFSYYDFSLPISTVVNFRRQYGRQNASTCMLEFDVFSSMLPASVLENNIYIF